MTVEFEQSMVVSFASLKRRDALRRANGQDTSKRGKDQMTFHMYRWLCHQFLTTGGQRNFTSYIFSHLFTILSWNLMCRAGNTTGIHSSHLEWREDAMGVYFAHMKNDQMGEKPKDPRHVYANPVMPAICPILSLGIYFLCNPDIIVNQGRLFPGSEQYARYHGSLKAVFRSEAGHLQLSRCGMKLGDIGTHSLRKGSSTYTTSDTPGGSSVSYGAMRSQAGWKDQLVDMSYIWFERVSSFLRRMRKTTLA